MNTITQTTVCPDCDTEYPSWADYTRSDACHKARQAARFPGEGFGSITPDDVPERTKHYGSRIAEQADYTPSGQGGGSATPEVLATEKQVAFINRLADERGVLVSTDGLTKSAASKKIDELLAAPKPPIAAPTPPTSGCVRKPNKFAGKCLNCGGMIPAEGGYLAKTSDGRWAVEHSTCLAAPEPVPAYVSTKGDVHVIGGEYYRIHESQGTGRHYAAQFIEGRFEYARGVIAHCNADNLATAEQAATFGHMFHRCVFCSRALDLPQSVEVGYGEVCASRHGLPWGVMS